MWVYDNDTVSDTFIVDLTKDRDVQDNLPCNFLSVRNDSSLIAFVYLDNRRVGAVQAYSADPFIGKNFEIIMIKQPDGDSFAIGDLFLQVGKDEQMSSTPYNPSWDMLEENIDVYASGCDNRFSYSATLPLETIKYWINVYNNIIVQRRLDIQGSASLGTYEITFSGDTVLSGGAPINGEVLDTKQYKKHIIDSEFDYSVTNCSIKGWMIDYKKTNDVIDTGTITIDAPGNGDKAIDNDLTTHQDEDFTDNTTWHTVLEITFPESTINEAHFRAELKKGTSGYSQAKLQAYNGTSWVDITDIIQENNANYQLHTTHKSNLNLSGMTKARISKRGTAAGWTYLRTYDMTINP